MYNSQWNVILFTYSIVTDISTGIDETMSQMKSLFGILWRQYFSQIGSNCGLIGCLWKQQMQQYLIFIFAYFIGNDKNTCR